MSLQRRVSLSLSLSLSLCLPQRTKNVVNDMFAGVRQMLGGEIVVYTDLLREAR